MDASDRLRGLRSDDPDQRARAFEALILDALNLTEADAEALAAAYRLLSSALLSRAPGQASGLFELEAQKLEARHVLGVWGLVYGWRTFEISRRLIREFPSRGGLVVEIGGGWGPYALQAALHGGRTRIVEPSKASAALTTRVFELLGLEAPERVHRPVQLADVENAELVALPYSLWEIRRHGEAEASAAWMRALLGRAAPSARVHVVESGNRDASRALQEMREVLHKSQLVLGPCGGVERCPRLAASDWCHFTWRSAPGRLTRQVADLAGRRWQEVHASWLVVGSTGAVDAPRSRLLEVRSRGKAKLEAEICGADGLLRLTALARSKAVVRALESLDAGSPVTLNRALTVEKGDGLRLLDAGALQGISEPFG